MTTEERKRLVRTLVTDYNPPLTDKDADEFISNNSDLIDHGWVTKLQETVGQLILLFYRLNPDYSDRTATGNLVTFHV